MELGLQCEARQDCLEDDGDMLICVVVALFGGLKGNLFCLSLRWDLAVLPVLLSRALVTLSQPPNKLDLES